MRSKNTAVVGLSFLAILFLLSFSLAKNFWQKKQDQKNKDSSATEQSQEDSSIQSLNLNLISPEETENKIGEENFVLIDLRDALLFEDNHIEGSLNLAPQELANFPLSEKNKTLIIIDETENTVYLEEINQLIKKDFQVFYLEGGFRKYQALGLSSISFGYPDSPYDTAKTRSIDKQTLEERLQNGEVFRFLDVREKTSFEKNHISNSHNIPLEELEKRRKEVPFGRVVVVDENPVRAFQAAVRLFDMHFIDILYFSENLTVLKQ